MGWGVRAGDDVVRGKEREGERGRERERERERGRVSNCACVRERVSSEFLSHYQSVEPSTYNKVCRWCAASCVY